MRTHIIGRSLSCTLAAALALGSGAVGATNTPHDLSSGNFSQDWSNIGLITTSDDWSGVPSIMGFRGDGLTVATGVDPQTVVASEATLDINANQTNPATFSTGGLAEFELANPTVALTGSGTADAPYLVVHLNTTGRVNVVVTYNVRDIEASADDAIQQVALQYRVGNAGNFTNLPLGYIADATTVTTATQVTAINVTLPADAENQAEVQVRMITTNAAGNDEWVGIDDIVVTSEAPDPAPTVTIDQGGMQADPATGNPIVFDVLFSEPVTGFGADDVALSGTATASVTSVTGSDASYTVTVTATTNGTIVADIPAGGAVDTAMQGNLVSTSTDNTVTLADPAPTVTIDQGAMQADPTASNPIVFDVVFSEPVTGFDSADVTLGGTATASVASVTGSDASYTVNVNASTSGTVTATVNADAAVDSLTQGNAASTSTDNQVTVDLTVPEVVSITGAPIPLVVPGTATFTIVFSQAVTGVDISDFSVSFFGGSGSITGVGGAGTTWTVTVNVANGSGVSLNLIDNDSIVNALNVPLGGVGAGNGDSSASLAAVTQVVPTLDLTGLLLMLGLFGVFGLVAVQRRMV